MKRKGYTKEQIAFCLRQHESGTPGSPITESLRPFWGLVNAHTGGCILDRRG